MKYKDGFKVVYKLDYWKIKETKYISFNRRPAIEVEYIPNIPTTRKSKPMNIYTDEHENEYILSNKLPRMKEQKCKGFEEGKVLAKKILNHFVNKMIKGETK